MNRKLHRWLGFAAAILFLYVATTGVILQVQQLFGAEEGQREAIRSGVNYNLPYTNKLVNLHFEWAHNSVSGPSAIVTDSRSRNEVRLMFRVSLQRYNRH